MGSRVRGGGVLEKRRKPVQTGFIDLALWAECVAIACSAKFQLYEPFEHHIFMVKIGTDYIQVVLITVVGWCLVSV